MPQEIVGWDDPRQPQDDYNSKGLRAEGERLGIEFPDFDYLCAQKHCPECRDYRNKVRAALREAEKNFSESFFSQQQVAIKCGDLACEWCYPSEPEFEGEFADPVMATPDPLAAEGLREAFKIIAASVDCLPMSREKSLALTKLEEASFWAQAANARYPD